MTNNMKDIQEFVFDSLLKKSDIDFLEFLRGKQKKVDAELKSITNKKEKIIKKISNNKENIEKIPRELRNHISNSESVLESINTVENNLNDLLSNYRSIENDFVILSEKIEIVKDPSSLKNDVNSLSKKIDHIISYEETINKDNEKNYLIINSFLDNKDTKDIKDDTEKIDFSDLTLDNLQDNMVLKICEKRVELPYTRREVEEFIKTYPNDYKTVQDVITKEFMIHISLFNKHPILARFKEAYYLCRTKEMMSILDSFNFAKNIMFRSDINAYIIAAVKNKKQLEEYIKCVDENKLDDFKYFKIKYEINPL